MPLDMQVPDTKSLILLVEVFAILAVIVLSVIGISKNRETTFRLLIAISVAGLAFGIKELFFNSPFDRYMREASQGYYYQTVWATAPNSKAVHKLDKALAAWVPADGLEHRLHALCWRANLLNLESKNKEAVSDFNQAIQIDPYEYRLYLARANAFSDLGKVHEALSDYSTALELTANPKTLKYVRSKHDFIGADYANNIYYSRALFYYKAKDFENAIQDFSKVIEADNNVGVYYRLRGRAFNRTQKYPQAIDDFSKSLTLPCADAIAYRERGYAYMQTGQFEKAIADFTRANSKENYPPFKWFNFHERALAYRKLGLIDKASQDDLEDQKLVRWVSGKDGMKDLPPG